MCGIVGFVGKNKDKNKIIESMNNKLIHRGPDDFGTYIDDNCALGHRRLAIIDLKTGKQPISDGKYTIIFNGEIYNFLELKEELKKKYTFKTKTDTEVILKGYEEWGTDVTKKLKKIRDYIDKNKLDVVLSVDGGINDESLPKVKEAGILIRHFDTE